MVYCCSVADIELCADFRRCLLTVSADIARIMMYTACTILHNLWAGWGGVFDVTHEVTIIAGKFGEHYKIMNQSKM